MAVEESAQDHGKDPRDRYDVAILGGGLAGLTLAIQLKKERPETSILVAEKRPGEAPEAAFKVGESTVELSAEYFTNVIGMKDHMKEAQNPKAGLRFFFPADGNVDIAQRVEWGSPRWPVVPAYQLDRGRFENELAARAEAAGVTRIGGCRIQDVELGDEHRVIYTRDDTEAAVSARWVVDATGRAHLMKNKLGLAKGNGHHVNSAWFRLGGGLDIESWSNDEKWLGRMAERGLRGFSTNHLMGEGYWVWLIPLASGPISIGVVADPRFHGWEEINTLDGMIDWLKRHEPQLGEEVDGRRDQVEDFLKVEDFSYGCKQVFSADRWCLTGEAGAFLDPLYSPGSDFIAMSNSFITDVVTRELDGEDVSARIAAHEAQYFSLFEHILSDYRGQYGLFGDAQVMVVKHHWDYGYYWSFPALWFFQKKWWDLDFMESVSEEYERGTRLHLRMQELFRDWHDLGTGDGRDAFVTLFPWLIQISDELDDEFTDDELRAKATRDREALEAFAVVVFEKAARLLDGHELDRKRPINPYAVSLDPDRWEADGLYDDESGITWRDARKLCKGLQFAWLDEFSGVT
jgi:flavin-dependent dehydrogenase